MLHTESVLLKTQKADFEVYRYNVRLVFFASEKDDYQEDIFLLMAGFKTSRLFLRIFIGQV